MKRVRTLVVAAFVGSMIVGCESGLQEGSPTEGPMAPANDQFKQEMQKNAAKMQMKGAKPKAAPAAAPATPSEPAAEKEAPK